MEKKDEDEVCADVQTAKEEESAKGILENIRDFFESSNAKQVTEKIIDLYSNKKDVETKALYEEKRAMLQADIQYKKFQSIIQLSVFSIGLIAVACLTYLGKFDAGIATLVGTMVGYFFGKNKNS